MKKYVDAKIENKICLEYITSFFTFSGNRREERKSRRKMQTKMDKTMKDLTKLRA